MRINRNKYERIEDAFSDLNIAEQAHVLDSLKSLHRWAIRMKAKQAPAETKQAEIPGMDGAA